MESVMISAAISAGLILMCFLAAQYSSGCVLFLLAVVGFLLIIVGGWEMSVLWIFLAATCGAMGIIMGLYFWFEWRIPLKHGMPPNRSVLILTSVSCALFSFGFFGCINALDAGKPESVLYQIPVECHEKDKEKFCIPVREAMETRVFEKDGQYHTCQRMQENGPFLCDK